MIMFVELKSKLGQMYAFYRRKRPCGKRPRRRLIDIYPIPGDRSYKTTPQERSDYSKDQYKIGRNLRMPGLGDENFTRRRFYEAREARETPTESCRGEGSSQHGVNKQRSIL